MSRRTILAWPVELIELVLVNLHPLDAVRCRQVCRFLRQLIDTSIELRLRIELAEDGHLLKHRGDGPAASLRKRVLLHRRALEAFNHKGSFKAETTDFLVQRYDITDGIIASLATSQGTDHPRRLIYHELDCPEGHQRWQKSWDLLEMVVTDVSFLGAEDLQILTEECDDEPCKRLHFRTISTNSRHPLAAFASFDLHAADYPVIDRSYTLMHDTIVMMIFKPYEHDLDGNAFAMDWKTGELVMPLRVASDACFIAKDLLLLSVNAGSEDQEMTPSLEIFSLTAKAILYRCLLPFARPAAGITIINNQNFDFPHNPYLSQPKEFVPDYDLNIVALIVDLDTYVEPQDVTVVAIIMVKQLVDLCERLALESPGADVQWTTWGPSATRWLPKELSDAGDLCIFGSRVVLLERRDEIRDHVILDFNPRNLQRESPSDNVSVIREPSTSIYHVLQGTLEVTSCLPYRKLATRRLPYSGIDLDGMNLVCNERGEGLHVLSLTAVEDNSGT